MKINVYAVGKIKEKYFADAISEYSKRLSRFADFSVIEISEAPSSKTSEEQRAFESARLLEKAKGYIIALDMEGKGFSSEEFAEFFKTKCNEGVSEFSFLIGGSHGHSDALKARADVLISFGKMTFPHQLFRVMLSEQIYRAMCINANTPYHK